MATNINKRKKHFNRFHDLKSEYETYHKQKHVDINDYIYPQGARFADESVPNDGAREDELIIDNTATLALRAWTSGMYSGVTSPASKWFRMTIDDPQLKEIASVKEYFDKVTEIILADFFKSNFYTIAEAVYASLGAFGTGAAQMEADPDKIFRFTALTIGQYYIDTDANGVVNTLFREFPMRARNVIEMFGDKVSDRIKRMIENNKSGSEWINILHVQEPNSERNVLRLDARNKPYLSTYYEISENDEEPPLRESGYDTKPFAVPRVKVVGSNTWGTGPGEEALGDVKELQTVTIAKDEALEKEVNGPLKVFASSDDVTVNSGADGVTFMDGVTDAQGRGIEPLYNVSVNMNNLLATIIAIQDRIKSTFYADLFFILAAVDKKNQTATEVIARQREQLRLLGPIIERMYHDFLMPILERAYDIENKLGRLPEPPLEIRGMDIKFDIISLIAQAQQLTIVTPIEQLETAVTRMAQTWPEVRDKFNPDQATDELGGALGIQSGIINSDEIVTKIRENRARNEARQQAQIQAQQAIGNAKELSETDVSGNNALTAIAGGG